MIFGSLSRWKPFKFKRNCFLPERKRSPRTGDMVLPSWMAWKEPDCPLHETSDVSARTLLTDGHNIRDYEHAWVSWLIFQQLDTSFVLKLNTFPTGLLLFTCNWHNKDRVNYSLCQETSLNSLGYREPWPHFILRKARQWLEQNTTQHIDTSLPALFRSLLNGLQVDSPGVFR